MSSPSSKTASAALVLLLLTIATNLVVTTHFVLENDVFDLSDSAYYYALGEDLQQGRWLTESIIVSHMVQYPEVVHPSFDHWHPLTSVASAISGWLVRDHDLGTKWVLLLFGSILLPACAYLFVRVAGGARLAAVAAAALTMMSPDYDYFRTVLESVTFAGTFLMLAAIALIRLNREMDRQWGPMALAGVSLGLMACTRGDALPVGILILASAAFMCRERIQCFVTGASGLLLVYSPLLIKNLAQFGSPFPPGSRKVFFVTEFLEWGAYGIDLDPSAMALLQARIIAVKRVLVSSWESPALGLGLVVIAMALFTSWRASRKLPAALVLPIVAVSSFYAVTLALAPAITLWFHRSPAPYLPLVFSGACLAADHLLKKRLTGRVRLVFGAGLILAVVLSLSLDPTRLWRADPRQTHSDFSGITRSIPPEATVMANAPMPLYAVSDLAVVRVPNNGEAAIVDALLHYDVQYLVLSREALIWADDLVLSIYDGARLSLERGIVLRPLSGGTSFRTFSITRPGPGN